MKFDTDNVTRLHLIGVFVPLTVICFCLGAACGVNLMQKSERASAAKAGVGGYTVSQDGSTVTWHYHETPLIVAVQRPVPAAKVITIERMADAVELPQLAAYRFEDPKLVLPEAAAGDFGPAEGKR